MGGIVPQGLHWTGYPHWIVLIRIKGLAVGGVRIFAAARWHCIDLPQEVGLTLS